MLEFETAAFDRKFSPNYSSARDSSRSHFGMKPELQHVFTLHTTIVAELGALLEKMRQVAEIFDKVRDTLVVETSHIEAFVFSLNRDDEQISHSNVGMQGLNKIQLAQMLGYHVSKVLSRHGSG